MPTLAEAELRQKISDLVIFAREYATNYGKDFTLKDKREGFKFSIFDKDITLEFEV